MKDRIDDYAKPWRQQPPVDKSLEAQKALIVSGSSEINPRFRRLLPGDNFDELTEYFFPKELSNRRDLDSAPLNDQDATMTNRHLYTKLFNSQFSIDKVAGQMKVSKPELSRRFAEFLTETSNKLQEVTSTIQSLPVESKIDNMLDKIRAGISRNTGARNVSIYLLEEVTQDFVVKTSSWLSRNKRISAGLILNSKATFKQEISNVFNVKNSGMTAIN